MPTCCLANETTARIMFAVAWRVRGPLFRWPRDGRVNAEREVDHLGDDVFNGVVEVSEHGLGIEMPPGFGQAVY